MASGGMLIEGYKNDYELPRFTRSLRAFTRLEGPEKFKSNEFKIDDLLKKGRNERRKRRQHEDVTWRDVKQLFASNTQVLKLLDNLYHLTKDLSKDQPKEIVEDMSIFLLQLFIREEMVLQKHIHTIKEMYGCVNQNLINKIFQVIHEINIELDEATIINLFSGKKTEENYFGKEIAFVPSIVFEWKPDCDILEKLCDLDNYCSISEKYLDNFTIKYDSNEKKSENVKKVVDFGRGWLIRELKKFYKSDEPNSLEDYADTILSLLKQDKSNDELQNTLFDVLGFDRFELIQLLLTHREEIICNCQYSHLESNAKLDSRQPSPALSSQVTVQSEQEKIMQKLARKEEKRMQKLFAKTRLDDDDEDEYDSVLESGTSSKKPLPYNKNSSNIVTISKQVTAKRKAPEFPHVYDSQDKAKQSAGFVSGVKLMLPEGVEKRDKKTYEEVAIPLSEHPPVDVGKNLVKTSTLNEIGKIAFEGIKTLNRIQSVVFETAYRSNENLLICAPTGAGKTNIALLTVVHQIEQHVENNVIKKDSFKIVYVAPMKALAAEMTRSFSKRLNPLGLTVKELTGDMQLTKAEILETQMLITTPEKWDVVTRKGTGDVALTKLVKLLIIDEVHLLHGDRGPVVEALVARTLRQVESSQSMIRIVGLSATLPNYIDVARFLRVNAYKGLYYFDSRFRPVPLSQTFIGVKATKPLIQMNDMDQVCYEKALEQVQRGHQVMVFVHARNATIRTANVLKELAMKNNQLHSFEPDESSQFTLAKKSISRVKNKQVADLFQYGFSCHHAGMLRADRSIIEKYFADGMIKVLVCTATLAWGVNLPAHAVIIKGTEIYDAKHGSFVDLGILDVLQIFGRAGRPQFDTSGVGIIITTYDKLSHYLSLLTDQFPIESNFINYLADNLNAEIALGTISNVDDAVEWLSYTYLFVRMRVNPLVYGINHADVMDDPSLSVKRRELIHSVAKHLDKTKMIRYNERTGDLNITDLGRTASHFYIKYDTVEIFNDMMKNFMVDCEILNMIAHAQEFHQLKVRDEELDELDQLARDNCAIEISGGSENIHGKVNILMQTYLSRGRVESFSLVSDQSYIIQNAVRIARGLFDIALRQNNALLTGRFLNISKMFELQMWDAEHPMKQFAIFGSDIISRLEEKKLSVERILDMDPRDIGNILRNPKLGHKIQDYARLIPVLQITPTLQPITRTVLRIRLQITANFRWNDHIHGKSTEPFWIWIEDLNTNFIYHSEYFLVTKKQVLKREAQELVMTIPLTEPLPSQYFVRAVSDRWLGSDTSEPLSFINLTLPESHPPHTDLLPLNPLPVSALENPEWENLYNFTHFNPIQTQIFHCLYHTDNNVLLGAPTGSGKTIAAEIAIFRVFRIYPGAKIVYIAPLKALVRERIEDWKTRFEKRLGRKVVELTGDVTPDVRAISSAEVIVTTPEKWDGISRSWQTRNYVRDVALIVIDEIHLLGEDRGPVLEVIVSRTNFISSHTKRTLRVIGLSTALANAKDLADWLGIGQMGLYNFRPSVRPVPLEVHIAGFPGKHYCPRMATMNKPTFQAIRQHSPTQPALVFVSSRRQTRLTALDLIAYLAGEDNPKQWLRMSEHEMDQIVNSTKDSNLKLTLAFGIGIHHAGLTERDRKTVEELFVNQKIQVLIATATLAWGVNFPAHLVVIKGTEYYDGKLKRYVDMPITDVLQMMGRAGRPQYDEQGVAVVLVHDIKKNFYKKFLYEPFPVESSLLEVLPDHLNAEIVSGNVQTKQEALDYLTWTYFFRRLLKNPTYYQLEFMDQESINIYLSSLVENAFKTLDEAYCIKMDLDERSVETTSMGRIASFYYLSYKTMKHFRDTLRDNLNIEELLQILSDVYEYDQLPVRHNEDLLNGELSKNCPLKVNQFALDSPHTKAQLLFQAHFSRLQLPCVDYLTDLKSVLDQAIRILQAMIDVCAEQGWLATTLRVQELMQMVIQGTWIQASPLLMLPSIEPFHLSLFRRKNQQLSLLPKLQQETFNDYNLLAGMLRSELQENEIEEIHKVLRNLPVMNLSLALVSSDEEGKPSKIVQPMKRDQWILVKPDREYTLLVKLNRENRNSESRAYAPKFPRGTDEGWFLTLGCINDGELLALKRVSTVRGNVSTNNIVFYTPKKIGRFILTVYVVSNCYVGLDQQFSINFEVTNKEIIQEKVLSKDKKSDFKSAFVDEGFERSENRNDVDYDEPIGRGTSGR